MYIYIYIYIYKKETIKSKHGYMSYRKTFTFNVFNYYPAKQKFYIPSCCNLIFC